MKPKPHDHDDPLARLGQLLALLEGAKRSGDGWMCRCPAHEDKTPSLSTKLGDDGRILVHCFAGCTTESVMAELGLPMTFLASPASTLPTPGPKAKSPRSWASPELAANALAKGIGTVEAIYDYAELDGTCTFKVVRIKKPGGKTFRPLHQRNRAWQVGDPDRLLPLYRMPEIATERIVVVVEGEKCVETAIAMGVAATTSAHGANSPKKTDWTRLKGKRVVLCPDADEPGRQYVTEVAGILRTIDAEANIRRLDLPGLAEGEDIVDYVESLRAKGMDDTAIGADLERLVAAAPAWPPPSPTISADCAPSAPGGAVSKWLPPLPIVDQVLLPKFPIDTAFPSYLSRLKDYVVAVADCYQVPVDAVALLILPIIGLGLSKRFEVEPFPGWREQLSLYVLVLLPSGERKTAVMRTLLAPIYSWQNEIATGMADTVRQFENKEEVVRERLDRARRKAARNQACDDSIDDLSRDLSEIEEKKPRPPSLVVTEGTTEAIARSLVLNHERTLLAAAEGDALDIMLGRYSGAPNFGVWLSGHSGDAVDSVRRGREPDRLKHPCLQVALSVQPEAVMDLLGSQAAQGRGVVPRFFISLPESKVGYRDLVSPAIPTQLVDYYGTRIQSHLGIQVPSEPEILRFAPDALTLLNEFRAQNEVDLRHDGDLAFIRAWGSKLPGAVARIAGIYRAFEPAAMPEIDAETVRCALSLVPYLTEHYAHVGAIGGEHTTVNLALRIDAWIRRNRLTTFNRRGAFNQVKGLAKKVEAIDPALDLLEERHRIARLPTPPPDGPGRPPSPTFVVNPELISKTQPPEQKEQNPQNPSEGGLK